MRKIKKKDTVVFIAGSSKGHVGEVLSVDGNRVKVAGGKIVKKAVKPNPQKQSDGGIISMEAYVDISNVAIYNPISNKADRVGFRLVDGKKVRYFKSNGEQIDQI
ncbi:MAG: 50S ribosomal protein L24 [Legionellaceae bacterium]|nr:50S ribosomal protein L24 [Legionellaceae bacterium]